MWQRARGQTRQNMKQWRHWLEDVSSTFTEPSQNMIGYVTVHVSTGKFLPEMLERAGWWGWLEKSDVTGKKTNHGADWKHVAISFFLLIARCEICIWGMATNGNGSIEVIKKFIFISNAVSSMWVDFLMRDLQSVIAYWCFQEDTWIICRMK